MQSPLKTFTALAVGLALSSTAAASQYGMSLHHELVTDASGAITTAAQASVDSLWNVAEKQVTEVADGVYRIAGWGSGNVIAVEGPKGWVIVDSGDNVQYATEQRTLLEQTVGDNIKVAGVVYTHSHYVWGTQAWMDEDTQVYAHEDMLSNLQADNGVSILSGNFNTRAILQFGMLHPSQGPDAFPSKLGFSMDKLLGEKGFVPPSVTFKDGVIETHTIGGLTVEVLPSKTDVLDSVAFYFPEKKLLVSNAIGSDSIFNLYTLRGDLYRDPMRLVEAADLALTRDIEVHVDIHGSAVIGKEAARANIEFFRDSMQLIHDQTYRAISQGKDAQEAAESIYMPQAMRANRETYGQVESHVKQVYAGRIGWMGWDVYDINPLPKAKQAANIVNGMGGVDAVLAQAKAANAKQELSSWQWSLFLTSQLQAMGAQREEAKQVRAEAARALGQHTTSANARGWYISEALLNEEKLTFAGHVITDLARLSQHIGAVTADKLAKSPLHDNVHYLRFMVDTRLAEGKRAQFNVNFAEENASYAIALRNGVIAITDRPNGGKTFELSKDQWDAMLLGTNSFSDLDKSLTDIDYAIGR